MRNYELALLLKSQLDEEEIRGVVERVKEIVASRGGEVRKVDFWGRRKLAYPVEKETEGYYLFVYLTLSPEETREVSRQVRLLSPVLRHLLVCEVKGKEKNVLSKNKVQVDQRAETAVSEREVTLEESSNSSGE